MNEVIEALNEGRLLEMFGTGNACLVCPIGNINFKEKDYHIPTTTSLDKLYLKLLRILVNIQYGQSNDHPDWVEEVYPQ